MFGPPVLTGRGSDTYCTTLFMCTHKPQNKQYVSRLFLQMIPALFLATTSMQNKLLLFVSKLFKRVFRHKQTNKKCKNVTFWVMTRLYAPVSRTHQHGTRTGYSFYSRIYLEDSRPTTDFFASDIHRNNLKFFRNDFM